MKNGLFYSSSHRKTLFINNGGPTRRFKNRPFCKSGDRVQTPLDNVAVVNWDDEILWGGAKRSLS